MDHKRLKEENMIRQEDLQKNTEKRVMEESRIKDEKRKRQSDIQEQQLQFIHSFQPEKDQDEPAAKRQKRAEYLDDFVQGFQG